MMNKTNAHNCSPWQRLLRWQAFFVLLYFTIACKVSPPVVTQPPVVASKRINPAEKYSFQIASRWAELQMQMTQMTFGYAPPVAARAFGLAGLTMYESIVPGMLDHRSLASQINQLGTLPQADSTQEYNWALSLNAGQAYMMRALFTDPYLTEHKTNLRMIDSLEARQAIVYRDYVSDEVKQRSEAFGKAIAQAIFEWSKTDGGHEGYKRNYPNDYERPTFAGAWQPTENGYQIPMLPTWGNNRPFVAANVKVLIPPPIPFSTSKVSQYYAQYLEVYTKNLNLTQQEMEIAVWWADNPGESFTPPGHSYNIANIAAMLTKATLGKAAEGFARTGIAVADAFICCWKSKYTYYNERPYTMIRRAIDPLWKPFWPAPPFPGYASGHATQAGAAAEVLTNVYGNLRFIDMSHVGKRNDLYTGTAFRARTFNNFFEFAEEATMSRFYGGIHTRQDNEEGLKAGKLIGKNVNTLKFLKPQ